MGPGINGFYHYEFMILSESFDITPEPTGLGPIVPTILIAVPVSVNTQ